VTPDDVIGQRLTCLGKMHFFMPIELDQALSLEAVEHLRDRGGRNAYEGSETRADHVRSLIGKRVDGLEVFLDRRRAGDDC
jgi:hypothetical protein